MSDKAEPTLRLLIVDDSVDDAEAIVSAVRNDGIAVRPLRPTDADQLHDMLSQQHVDLVLAAHSATGIPLADVTRAVKSSDKDIPVVGLVDETDNDRAKETYVSGARRLALRGEPVQLLRVLRLEWEDLRTRRRLRRLDAQVRETERRCDALIESSRDPIAYVHEGMHIRANAAYLEMFGFDGFEDLEGMSLLDLVAPKHVNDFKQLLKSLSKGEPPPSHYELEARDAEGESFPARMEFTQAMYQGEACQQVVFRRQDQDPELAREVEALRQRDHATGLFNRQTFLKALEDAVADSAENLGQHGLLLLEPDHYQRLLHEIGLDSADTIIATLARRLEQSLEDTPNATLARFSEHSLAVLLRGADHATTSEVAERVRSAFDGVMEIGDHSIATSVSIGGVQIGERIASVSQVLAKAHQGLQSSFGVGGNRLEIFDPSAVDRAEEERIQAWLERLHAALENDGFVLHFQPIINLQGEPGAAYETLIRLKSETGETIPPAQFLPLAEEHGLMGRIDAWVAREAIRILGECERNGQPTVLMVKVSQASLGDDSFVSVLRSALAEHGVPGERLVLLLSEAKVFAHLQSAKNFAQAVTALGCHIGLEHFGGGLDSSQLLSHLQPAFVKLDGSFAHDLASTPENQDKVRSIAERTRDARIHSIACFVEDATSMAILYNDGIEFVQGDFLAPADAQLDYEFE